jgi:hypothetical protein
MIYLVAFGLFALAVAAMGVGAMFTGRKLSGSCGGMSANGQAGADCSCARKEAELCTDGPEQELVDLAELGWPQRRDRHDHPPKAAAPKNDPFEV